MKQEETEKVEVYYEWIQKLAHGLQIPTTYSFPIIMFRTGLQLYLKIATIRMKRLTFQQHKEVMMLCEEGMITVEAKSALLVPHSTKQTTPPKTQGNTWKIDKCCTNCGMTNHNVETCIKKKEHTIMATTKAAQPNQKLQKTSLYAYHICGLNGHKMIDCPKFIEMQKMFHGKSVIVVHV